MRSIERLRDFSDRLKDDYMDNTRGVPLTEYMAQIMHENHLEIVSYDLDEVIMKERG